MCLKPHNREEVMSNTRKPKRRQFTPPKNRLADLVRKVEFGEGTEDWLVRVIAKAIGSNKEAEIKFHKSLLNKETT